MYHSFAFRTHADEAQTFFPMKHAFGIRQQIYNTETEECDAHVSTRSLATCESQSLEACTKLYQILCVCWY